MFSTCIFCTRPLGANESIEAFPVGRRLAFDASRGRLWAVCTHCDRWNLTPIEERWEAIETAERLYSDSKHRVATENIGLARMRDGLDLVRIGQPRRPEMAAWRYGDQFRRRRRRAMVGGALAVGAVSIAGVVLMPVNALIAGLAMGMGGVATFAGAMGVQAGGRNALFGQRWISDGKDHHLLVTGEELFSTKLSAAPDGGPGDTSQGWVLRVPYRVRKESRTLRFREMLASGSNGEATITGPAAADAVRRILLLMNGWGASSGKVQDAVRQLDELGGPERAFARAASNVREYGMQQAFGDTGALRYFPYPVRLALEMAAHEEQERLALEGELAELERAWQEAEEIAAISDDLILPGGVRARFERLRHHVLGRSPRPDRRTGPDSPPRAARQRSRAGGIGLVRSATAGYHGGTPRGGEPEGLHRWSTPRGREPDDLHRPHRPRRRLELP